ncbi:MAG: glycosyltransferase family 87 protein, partial [Acidimicrobiales bacterium]
MFWLVLVTIAGVSVGHLAALASAVDNGNSARIGLDYRAFVAAGKLLWTGRGTYIYLPDSIPFLELARVGFVYPPWAALFMVPWSALPFGLGLALWTISGLLVMVIGLRWCGIRDWRPVGYAMITFPAVFALGLGQSTFWLVGVVAVSVGAMQRQSEHLSGATLGIAAWKPHLLGGFVLLWLAHPRRYIRQVVSFVVTSLFLLVV